MNADTFRQLYEYHFAINRKIWDVCIVPLTDGQFQQKINYSVGSVRNLVVHMLNMDDRWFCGLRGEKIPGLLNPVHYAKRDKIRSTWDRIEVDMRRYFERLRDDMFTKQPYLAVDGDTIMVWQVLFHVINHGTEHRTQLLQALNQLGVKTFSQDYALFIKGFKSNAKN
jgi:uncharacterized damage-inducible protein DinB